MLTAPLSDPADLRVQDPKPPAAVARRPDYLEFRCFHLPKVPFQEDRVPPRVNE